MRKNPLNQGIVSENAQGVGEVTRAQLQARTRELALIAGRTAQQVTQADYAQAKRELTGATELDQQDAMLDALPESKRWDPVPGSTGHQAPESPPEGEDEEGRNESAQLVEEGVKEAEHDQMRQASRQVDP
jgi:hypothetical protein